MKILICPDSFKETLTSYEVCNAISEGLVKAGIEKENIKTLPIADGGEGTLECIKHSYNIELLNIESRNPLGIKIATKVGIDKQNKIGFIEMATTSGLTLLNEKERNPFETTTYGVGEQILELLKLNCKKIYIGVGGSATNDGGIGMAQALGILFLNKENEEITINKERGYSCNSLDQVYKIDISNIDQRIYDTEIIVLSDVNNPLLGKNGASLVYSEQKGATVYDKEKLDKLLTRLNESVIRSINFDMNIIIGGGAAGGLAAGLVTFLKAKIAPGLEIIGKLIDLDKKIQASDIIITGEGKMDKQTVFGKAPHSILKMAKKYNKKVYALNGFLEKKPSGFDGVYGTNTFVSFDPNNIEKNAKQLLINLSTKFASDILISK